MTNKKKLSKGYRVAFIILGCIFLLLFIIVANSPNTPTDKWQEWQNENVSVIDGSCRPLEKRIKSILNDAGSYEHVETTYFLNVDSSIVTAITKFRAKNAYGAIVLSQYEARLDSNGKILNIFQEL